MALHVPYFLRICLLKTPFTHLLEDQSCYTFEYDESYVLTTYLFCLQDNTLFVMAAICILNGSVHTIKMDIKRSLITWSIEYGSHFGHFQWWCVRLRLPWTLCAGNSCQHVIKSCKINGQIKLVQTPYQENENFWRYKISPQIMRTKKGNNFVIFTAEEFS